MKLKETTSFKVSGQSLGIASLKPVLERLDVREIVSFNTKVETAFQKSARPKYNIDRMVKVHYNADISPEQAMLEIASDPSVEYAEPYYIFPLHHTPNDSRLSQQWAVDVMKLKEAWDITTGDSTIVVGDVDTGVDWKHEDLALDIWTNPGEWGTDGELHDNGIDDDNNGKVDDWHGWDFIGNGSSQNPNPDNDPMDGSLGHGTNTSGCAAARTNNGTGIAGSGYNIKILAVKAAADQTAGIGGGYEGIIYAAQMGCKIINCSWGGTGRFYQSLQDIIDDATEMGALVVGSSGNDPLDNDYIPHWPSSLNHVLNVGSVESSGAASTWCTFGTSVHVYSPGRSILTTRKDFGYTSPTGTSFSAPLAAGVAGLVMSVHPDWTPDQVAKQIRVTADAFDDPAKSKRFARINAYKAVSINETLEDIPGIIIKNFDIVVDGNLARFTKPGQTATVTVELQNILAPTSALAALKVAPDDPSISAPNPDHMIGELATWATKTIEFEVKLSDTPQTSEGDIPVRLLILDGDYVDYLMIRIPIYLQDAWHTSLVFGAPYFTGLHASSASVVYGNATVQTQDIGVRSINGGSSWTNVSGSGYPSGQGVYCVFSVDNNLAFAGTGPSNGAASIFKTVNGGGSWAGTSVSHITGFVNWIHMFDADNGVFQGDPKSGVWGIATTADGGLTWTPITNPVDAPSGEMGWNNAYDAVGDMMWFGTNNGKLYRSSDAGQTWSVITTPSKHSVNVSFGDAQRGIVRFTEQDQQGGEEMLAVTDDGGDTWTKLTSIAVTSGGAVEMEPAGKRIWYIKGADSYVSDDFGESWTVQATPGGFLATTSTSWANTTITDVYVAGLNIYKFRSDWQSGGSTGIDTETFASDFSIDYMYPNPLSAASSTGMTLGFTLEKTAGTHVQVYDNLGRLVRTALDARLAAGSHSVQLLLPGASAGTYYVRITAGGSVITKSLLVIR